MVVVSSIQDLGFKLGSKLDFLCGKMDSYIEKSKPIN